MSKPFAIVDLETTGLDPEKHEILGIAVKSPHGVFYSLVKPQHIEDADPKALEVNGYANNPEMWKDAPTIEEVLPKVLPYLRGGLFAAHNASFDYDFLNSWCRKVTGKGLRFFHKFDTITLAMEQLPFLTRFNLDNVCHVLGISNEGAHTALADVLRCEKVLKALLRAPWYKRVWWWLRFKVRGELPLKRG